MILDVAVTTSQVSQHSTAQLSILACTLSLGQTGQDWRRVLVNQDFPSSACLISQVLSHQSKDEGGFGGPTQQQVVAMSARSMYATREIY